MVKTLAAHVPPPRRGSVRGSEFVAALPEALGKARETAIFEAVRAGHVVVDWSPIEARDDRHVLRF